MSFNFKKLKKSFLTLTLSGALLMSSNAIAADDQEFTPYIGVGVSNFIMDLGAQPAGVTGFDTKPSAIGYVVKAGINYKKYFGVELRTGATGDANTSGSILAVPTTMTVKLDNFIAYYLKAQIPFENGFGIYVLVGGSNASVSAKINLAGFTAATSSNASSGSFGAGITYRASKQLSIEAEYLAYAADVSAATIFASYHF